MATALLDLTGKAPPFRTVELDLLGPDLVTLVILPNWARRVEMQWETDPGKYSSEGNAGIAIDADHMTVPADTLHSFAVSRSGRAGRPGSADLVPSVTGIRVASAAGGTIFRLTLLPSAS